jgi:hypothetical protein
VRARVSSIARHHRPDGQSSRLARPSGRWPLLARSNTRTLMTRSLPDAGTWPVSSEPKSAAVARWFAGPSHARRHARQTADTAHRGGFQPGLRWPRCAFPKDCALTLALVIVVMGTIITAFVALGFGVINHG